VNKKENARLRELLTYPDEVLGEIFDIDQHNKEAEASFKSGGICISPKFDSIGALRQWIELLVSSEFAQVPEGEAGTFKFSEKAAGLKNPVTFHFPEEYKREY
jgi:hypothetical protein